MLLILFARMEIKKKNAFINYEFSGEAVSQFKGKEKYCNEKKMNFKNIPGFICITKIIEEVYFDFQISIIII